MKDVLYVEVCVCDAKQKRGLRYTFKWIIFTSYTFTVMIVKFSLMFLFN